MTISESVTSIGEDAFRTCSSLKNITIPNSVTEIGNCAFLDCASLMNVTLGKNVTTIGDFAFDGCLLFTIYCYAELPPTCDVYTIRATDRPGCKLYVTKDAYPNYQADDFWSQFYLQVMDSVDGIAGVQQTAGKAKNYDLQGRVAVRNARGILIKDNKKFVK